MASVKAPSTMASAPPTAPAKAAAVRRTRLVQGSARVSMRPDERASIRAGTFAPQARVIWAQTIRAARSLAMAPKGSASIVRPRTMRAKAASRGMPARTRALA